MSGDRSGGRDDKKGRDLPEEIVEKAKRHILFGEVGYKRPPASGQFKKGQSGNPKGRPKDTMRVPKSDRSANALALKAADRLVTVREGEERRQVPAIEAVLLAQIGAATRGNAYAQKHFIERYDWAERERRQKVAEEAGFWKEYVARQREAIDEAKRRGEALPEQLPHPDDVFIDDEKGVRIIGPVNEDELRKLEETLKFRDALIIQDALDQRESDKPTSKDPLEHPGSALVFMHVLNMCVPDRHKLTDVDIIQRMGHYSTMPKRLLLRELYRSWRAIGIPACRGATFPSLGVAKAVVERINDHLEGDCRQA